MFILFQDADQKTQLCFFDLGPGDFDWFTEHHRYQPRAVYLLKNQWVQIQLGVYVIEYTINDGVAYSHYSLNYGISYHIYMETELTTNRESNQNILVDLFKETEELDGLGYGFND